MMEIMIRKGKADDAADLADVETACFPPAEAATAEEIAARLSVYPSHFFLLYADGILTGFIDGMVTNEKDLRDEMYADASSMMKRGLADDIRAEHTPILSETWSCRPPHRSHERRREKQGREGIVLTCKEELIHYYAKFGFENEGKSNSSHGNVTVPDAPHILRMTELTVLTMTQFREI